MKKLYYLLVTVSIGLVSCMNCTWVQTDYYYDDDGEIVEEGYYDCPEDNPVSYDFLRTPEIEVEFTNKRRDYFNECTYSSHFKIRNWGSGIAYNVLVSIKISRPDIPRMGYKSIEFVRNFDSIDSYSSEIIEHSFKDISYIGHSLFLVEVKIKFEDKNGKSRNYNNYYEF